MIETKNLFTFLKKEKINFFTGVPDSVLKETSSFLEKKNKLDPDITNANIKNAKKIFGYKATIYFDQGYKNFLKWFLEYHK